MAGLDLTKTIFQWLGFARYNTSPPTTTNGQVQELQGDVNGALLVNIAAVGGVVVPTFIDFVPGASGVIKNAAGSLFSIYTGNCGASARFLQLFDAAAVPVDGAVPKMVIPLASNNIAYLPLPRPKGFTTGICWAVSSTAATKTLDGTALVQVTAEYK